MSVCDVADSFGETKDNFVAKSKSGHTGKGNFYGENLNHERGFDFQGYYKLG